jgi:hypothetical protein
MARQFRRMGGIDAEAMRSCIGERQMQIPRLQARAERDKDGPW